MFHEDGSKGASVKASCVYSRLPVEIRPEWTDVSFGSDFRFNLSLIGQQIICTRPKGFGDERVVQETLRRIDEAVKTRVSPELPFVWVADYSHISGITMGGRKTFASSIAGWPGLRAMILIGLTPVLSAIVRLGIRLNLFSFPVRMVSSYPEAIEVATAILDSLPASEMPAPISPVVVSNEGWKLVLPGYSIRFEVIDGSILHSVQGGSVREEHLDPVFDLRDRVMLESGLRGKDFSILAGLENVEKANNAGRLGYVRRMARWYQENPFEVEVFYGMNPMMGTVINVSAKLAPFKVHVSKSYEEGLEYISNFVAANRVGVPEGSLEDRVMSRHEFLVSPEKIDDLLGVIGAISWDTDDAVGLETIDPEDPFAPVYEALFLVKTELDELLALRERDATERRRLQERLARSEKMEALGLLAGGLAHDLNNILSGIVSYPELLLMDENLSLEMRRAIGTIKKSGDQAAAVVKDLMAVSRGAVAKTQPVSLGAVVKEYLGSPDFAAMSSNFPCVTITTHLDEDSALVSGSPVQLRNVVANLVTNAVESFGQEKHEGRVEVETFYRQTHAGDPAGPNDVPDGDWVVLRVADTGQGIDEANRERIFEPFFTKKILGRSGTGLGLTVVWNIVKNHDGVIDLASGENGTVFTIFLPLTTEGLPEKNFDVSLAQLFGHGQRILVVDDVAEQREIAAALLGRLGYEVATVSSGEAAIERLRSEEFDLLLLDMLMEPGLNGRETYERVLEFRPRQKTVIASGFSQDDEVQKARALGAGAFIAKPYSLEEIGTAVLEVLGENVGVRG